MRSQVTTGVRQPIQGGYNAQLITPEVTGSNPVPATTKALARDSFGEVTKEF